LFGLFARVFITTLYVLTRIELVISGNIFLSSFCTSVFPYPWQLEFQFPITSFIEGLIYFHHDSIGTLLFLSIFIRYFLAIIICYFQTPLEKIKPLYLDASRVHNEELEIIWTFIPIFILISIIRPSLSLLYSSEDCTVNPEFTIKITGNQWYWNYSVCEETAAKTNPLHDHSYFLDVSWDSYIIQLEDLQHGRLRLLEVDEPLWLPTFTPLRLVFTSNDVIHSWSVPCLRIKVDCIPGHLNQLYQTFYHARIFYRQCSELCGALHTFIPIKVDIYDFAYAYAIWITYDSVLISGKYQFKV
jgi:cytochrome c oxidase subunit 2